MKKIDLTGQRFGRLLVINDSGERQHRNVMWDCLCDCGETSKVRTDHLRRGKIKSCGCYNHNRLFRDLTGERFGRLVAIEAETRRLRKGIVWKCKCDCGNITLVSENCLVTKSTRSCGCFNHDVAQQKGFTLQKNNACEFYGGTNVSALRHMETMFKSNTSGVRGVWPLNNGKWQAGLRFKKHLYVLGNFTNLEDAANARHKAEEQTFGNFVKWYDENIKNAKVVATNDSTGD